jgi:hypothetical protein
MAALLTFGKLPTVPYSHRRWVSANVDFSFERHSNLAGVTNGRCHGCFCTKISENVEMLDLIPNDQRKRSEWPAWTSSRQLGDCLFWEVFLKNTKVALFLTSQKFCINSDKKWSGTHLGRFFDKLIWSPWKRFRSGVNGSAWITSWSVGEIFGSIDGWRQFRSRVQVRQIFVRKS